MQLDEHRWSEGRQSLRLSSGTESTKWVYQVVRVAGGSWIEASALGMVDGGEAFVRLSWYSSADGSGTAIDNADSPVLIGTSFSRVSTGAVQAPVGAQTVKVRLMFRPAFASATAWFDDARLVPSSPVAILAAERDTSSPGNPGTLAARRIGGGTSQVLAAGSGGRAAPAGVEIMGPPVNDARGDEPGAAHSPVPSGGEGTNPLLLAIILIPLGIIVLILGRELFREDTK